MRVLVGIIAFVMVILPVVFMPSSPGLAQLETRSMTPRDLSAPPVTIDVSIVNFAFQPNVLTVNVNDTVKWTNTEPLTLHTTTSDTGFWDSMSLSSGQTFTHTFTAMGYFAYHCAIHPSMVGVVRVVAPLNLPVITRQH